MIPSTCCFPLETKVRDLDGAIFLSLKLLALGYDCIIGRNAEVNAYLPFIRSPFLYFEGGASLGRLDFIDWVHSLGGMSFSLLNEGGVFEKDMRGFMYKFSKEYIDRADAVFLWGDQQRALLLEQYGADVGEKLFAYGHPRFDLRRPERIVRYRNAPSPAREHAEGYILVNLSGAHYTHHLSKEDLFEMLVEGANDDYSWEHYNNHYEYQKQRFTVFCEMVRRLHREFPDREIILRPHPDENRDLYHRELGGLERVFVTCSGSVLNWIARSSVIVHHDCTTALEAIMLGKPVLSYCEVFQEDLVQHLPVKASLQVFSQDDLVSRIKGVLAGSLDDADSGYSREDQLAIISRIIKNVDFDASDRISETAHRLAGDYSFKRNEPYPSLRERSRRRVIDVLASVSDWKNRKNVHYIRQRNKFPTLTSNDIKSLVGSLSSFVDDMPPVRHRKLGRNLHLLQVER